MKPTVKLLDRDTFRESVFKRDGHKCIVCGEAAKDAHHLMERRLFSNGGYFIDNGVSLCEIHHIAAEQTKLSPDYLRSLVVPPIETVILPDDLYDEFEYTKWGDIVLANKTRLKGPLFNDESVQKVLESGGVLGDYSKYNKYPRTFHLPYSPGLTKDDRQLATDSNFIGKEVVVHLKLDGEQFTGYFDGYCHARSVDGESHWTQNYARKRFSEVFFDLPKNWRVNCENLYAKHSIKYDELDDFLYLFHVWNEKNEALSWKEAEEWAKLLGLTTCPVIYSGIYDKNGIIDSFEQYRNKHEGFVVRIAEKFHYSQFKNSVAKYVRRGHVQTSNHWKFENIEKNELKKSS